MAFRWSKMTLIGALCFSLGWQWLALQSFAWTTMLVENSQRLSWAQAIARTFDGAQPCRICKAVSEAQRSEKKPAVSSLPLKMDLFCTARLPQVAPAAADYSYPQTRTQTHSLTRVPLVPPPRAALS